ncbi:MAG: hypothetical protein LUD29_02250 [Clostridia bacterium]|nr:hypothetical protein [Clostridia bacterium]
MSDIMTPLNIWDGLDLGLEPKCRVLEEFKEDDVTLRHLMFLGRDTGEGRVEIHGVMAYSGDVPSDRGVLYLPDSGDAVSVDILKLFASKGYSVLAVDYRGEGFKGEYFTRYPQNVSYANVKKAGRRKNFVDETADRTSWYEWCAAALYGKSLLDLITGSAHTAVVGHKDGGEIAWKIITKGEFSCAVIISAAGWDYCEGHSKFDNTEPALSDERYRFIAGVDSQSFAGYAGCPVMMICTLHDEGFDYDRAYDTFIRINGEHASESVILYSLPCFNFVSRRATKNMFMYLDKFVSERQIFIPRSSDVEIVMDEEKNLVAKVSLDPDGQREHCDLYFAEDELDFRKRFWNQAKFLNSDPESGITSFSLDIAKGTSQIFVLARSKYTNGFTVWSKIYTKKTSGVFKNSASRQKVLFFADGKDASCDGFSMIDVRCGAVGGVFATDKSSGPKIVERDGLFGITSPRGITTWKISSKRYAPGEGDSLKLDLYTDEEGEVTVELYDSDLRVYYSAKIKALGKVWQDEILDTRDFKSDAGMPLPSFLLADRLSVFSRTPFAVNNLMWL